MNEKLINEEYKIWKKTSPLLYDLLYTYSCDSPPLSVKWLKQTTIQETDNNEPYLASQFLMGTNSKESQNHIKLVSVSLPPTLSSEYTKTNLTIPENLLKSRQLNIVREWNHPGEVNKLQINEHLNLFATQTNTGNVLLFDINDKNSKTHKSTLKFHTKEGFGLEWNPNLSKKNLLLSSSEDCKIALWEINEKLSNEIKPSKVISTHDNIVNDISWNKSIDSVFASVSDDSSYQIHDLRLSTGPIVHITDAHHDPDSENNFNFPINTVDFNETVPTLLATGGSDNSIQIWDLRNPSIPLRRLLGHQGPVIGLQFKENYLLSSSTDHRVLIWDLNRLDEGEPDKRKVDYLDPCLSFMHGGHLAKISDADWHPTLENLVVSCADDGLLEVWRPSHLGDEYTEEEEEEEREEGVEGEVGKEEGQEQTGEGEGEGEGQKEREEN
jgi:histone-binding protein RBBP4